MNTPAAVALLEPKKKMRHRVQSKLRSQAPRVEASRPPTREEREAYLRERERQHLKS